MDLDPDLASSSSASLLAAALHVLSCSALHGLSSGKAQAIVRHLGTLADRFDTDPLLARSCDELADLWQRVADRIDSELRAEAIEQRFATEEKKPSQRLH